jgi:hypothetical protein
VAHAHTSLDEGVGPHGGYAGLDELLGLALGEGALDIAGEGTGGWLNAPYLQARGIDTLPMDRVSEQPYPANAAALQAWGGALARAPQCSAAFRLPMDEWAADHATGTRALCAWKFAAAQVRAAALARRHAAAGRADPGLAHHRTLFPPAHWPPAALHIGVHFRVADGKLLPASALEGVLRGTVLPALASALAGAGSPAAAATPIHIHVYSESRAPLEEAGELLALHGAVLAPGLAPLAVHHAGAHVGVLDALWQLAQCDIFVGSVSSFSWMVAHFASRPLPVLQAFDAAGQYAWCAAGGVCCAGEECREGLGALAATAARLARMAGCGQLSEGSWRAPDMPEVEEALAEQLRAGG